MFVSFGTNMGEMKSEWGFTRVYRFLFVFGPNGKNGRKKSTTWRRDVFFGPTWVWLNIKLGLRSVRSLFPYTQVSFRVHAFEPQPHGKKGICLAFLSL